MENLQKRKPKNPIRFNIELTQEQKEAKGQILNNKISILYGVAGTSKTLVAVQTALDQLFKREVNKIVIARPAVSSEEIGYLPGTIEEKMAPWMMPIMHNMYALYSREAIDKHMAEKTIEILPLQYIQGITFSDSIVILDEAQNATKDQIKLFLTRVGKTSRVVITGDTDQVMLKKKELSGFEELVKAAKQIEGMAAIEMKENYRDPIVREVLKYYK